METQAVNKARERGCHSIGKKMKHRYQSFTRIGRQFQSLERKVYADWTSVSFPFCQRSCLIWRIMTNTLTNTMTNTYVVIFLSVSIFGRGYHSRYQNFEFTAFDTEKKRKQKNRARRIYNSATPYGQAE